MITNLLKTKAFYFQLCFLIIPFLFTMIGHTKGGSPTGNWDGSPYPLS